MNCRFDYNYLMFVSNWRTVCEHQSKVPGEKWSRCSKLLRSQGGCWYPPGGFYWPVPVTQIMRAVVFCDDVSVNFPVVWLLFLFCTPNTILFYKMAFVMFEARHIIKNKSCTRTKQICVQSVDETRGLPAFQSFHSVKYFASKSNELPFPPTLCVWIFVWGRLRRTHTQF